MINVLTDDYHIYKFSHNKEDDFIMINDRKVMLPKSKELLILEALDYKGSPKKNKACPLIEIKLELR
jgi:hypothetical protein